MRDPAVVGVRPPPARKTARAPTTARPASSFLIGSRVKGEMVGEFPGLAKLDPNENLVNTSDFRAMYAGLLGAVVPDRSRARDPGRRHRPARAERLRHGPAADRLMLRARRLARSRGSLRHLLLRRRASSLALAPTRSGGARAHWASPRAAHGPSARARRREPRRAPRQVRAARAPPQARHRRSHKPTRTARRCRRPRPRCTAPAGPPPGARTDAVAPAPHRLAGTGGPRRRAKAPKRRRRAKAAKASNRPRSRTSR